MRRSAATAQTSPLAGDAPSPPERSGDRTITVSGVTLVADPAGALFWPDEGLLMEALTTGVVQSSKDAKERLRAFLEKRGPKVARPKE